MTPEIADVLTRVSEEIEVQIRLLEHHAVAYAGDYVESVLAGKQRTRQAAPAGMHPLVSKLIREATLDELAARRRLGGMSPWPGMTTNERSLDSGTVMARLEQIDKDLGERSNEYAAAAGEKARLTREWERRLAISRVHAKGNDADARKAAALVMAIDQDDLYDRLKEAEGQFEAMRVASRVLEARSMIGLGLLKGMGRA